MSPDLVWSFIQFLHYFALILWVGGILFLSFVAAPCVHRSMASREIAGEIVGKMLKRFNRIELFACLFLITTSFSSAYFLIQTQKDLWMLFLAIGLMGGLTAIYAFGISPRMEALKTRQEAFYALDSNSAPRLEFGRLHRLYVRLMSLNLLLGLGTLYLSIRILTS